MDTSVPRDTQVALLAAKQYGHVTRTQLTDLGITPSQINKRVIKGWLIRIHTGVYAVGHVRHEAVALAAAAVLAGGPDAVLGHLSAAALWAIRRQWPSLPEIVVPAKRRPAGIRVHVAPTLDRRDIRRHRGLRVTSPARTLLDIAPGLSAAALARAVNEARIQAGLRIPHLQAVVDRAPHHPGSKMLRAFVERPTGPTRSELERCFLNLVKRYGLPTPLMNTYVGGYEVDAFFPQQRVIVELDSWTFHRDRRSFELDRERDAAELAIGIPTIRVTWERMTEAPEREAARLHAILRART